MDSLLTSDGSSKQHLIENVKQYQNCLSNLNILVKSTIECITAIQENENYSGMLLGKSQTDMNSNLTALQALSLSGLPVPSNPII